MSGDLHSFASGTDKHGFATGAIVMATHPESKCAGEFCCIHNPSEHHMRDWPMHWRGDRALMERVCEHGTGHPDPDDLAFHVANGRTWQANHGCCGCFRGGAA